MEVSIVRLQRADNGRTRRLALVLGTCAVTLALATPALAQSLETRPTRGPLHQDHPKRARTQRPERRENAPHPKREDNAVEGPALNAVEGPALMEAQGDIPFLEERIRDLSTKVRELNELLQQHKEAQGPLRFAPRPMRATLLEKDREPRVAKTYGEAVDSHLRDRARSIGVAFSDPEQKRKLAIDPDAAEVRRLLAPIYEGLAVTGSHEEVAVARIRALIYVALLEARAKIVATEPLPALHKVLRDLHVDRTALTEHLRRSFLLDKPTVGRDLGAVLAATAAMYPDPPGARDFLMWLAAGVGGDLKDEAVIKTAYPYRGDHEGQFDAAAETANVDNGDVIKLQIELQRMHVEAKALRTNRRVESVAVDDWQYRLVQAERELDRLLQSADIERETVMTLARRVPVRRETTSIAAPAPDLLPAKSSEEVASDDLTTQH